MSRLKKVDRLDSMPNSSKKKILLVKLGSTYPDIIEQWGDFEHWIIAGMECGEADVYIFEPMQGDAFPDPGRYDGIVLTGSHAMVSDRESWSERTAAWLPSVVEAQAPLLGICYGHQLIAHALGGRVGDNPNGIEMGVAEIRLTHAGQRDPLLGHLPDTFPAHVSHRQSALELPPGAIVLASSEKDPHHAFRIPPNIWGVQFHPELNADIARIYIRKFSRALLWEGQDPQKISEAVRETPAARTVLKRFAEMVRNGFAENRERAL